MKISPTLMSGLMISTLTMGASTASYADSAAAIKAPANKASDGPARIADKDFGRLSADGVSAFNDVHMARRAIYDGQTDEAATLVADAKASLARAKTDDAILMKAESALRGRGQVMSNTQVASGKAPIAWIPVDSEIALGETFVSTPDNAAAVVTARKGLEKGESAKSLSAIKMAQIDVNYTVAVAPLEQSIAEIDQANTLIARHDYYGASQALRQAEDGIRYDEVDDVANVRGEASASTAMAK